MEAINQVLIKEFFKSPRPNVRLTVLHQLFLQTYPQARCSYSQFTRYSKRMTSVHTIRTGGTEVDLIKLSNVLVSRAFLGVHIWNVISIDEKPVIVKNYMVNSVRVLKGKKGPIYKSMMYGIKMKSFYIIAAVSYKGLISYGILDHPVTKKDFEEFIAHVAMQNSKEETQFLLYDNATFHNICDECSDILNDNHFEVTKTAPSSCFLDPIEEFFAIFDYNFKTKYQKAVIETGLMNPLSRTEIKRIINNSLIDSNTSLIGQFTRACIF